MKISLYFLATHTLFDWKKRHTLLKLSENFGLIIEHETGTNVNTQKGSEVYLLAQQFKYVALGKKNKARNQETFTKLEKGLLENKTIEIKEANTEETDDEEYKDEESKTEKKIRKKFVDLKCEKSKKIRVQDVVHEMAKDEGIEDAILAELKARKDSSNQDNRKEYRIKLFCMILMKTLNISQFKFDDFRWWLKNMIQVEGLTLEDLLNLPCEKTLRNTIMKDMIPPGMKTSETGASFPLETAFHHTMKRFLLR